MEHVLAGAINLDNLIFTFGIEVDHANDATVLRLQIVFINRSLILIEVCVEPGQLGNLLADTLICPYRSHDEERKCAADE